MNAELRKKQKMILKNIFFKLMDNEVFEKNIKNVRKRRSYKELFSIRTKLSYNFFSKCLLAIEMKIFMNTNTNIHIIPAYLGQSILEISKIVMYEIWYDYVKPKYGEKVKLSQMNTDSFIVYVKTEGIYVKVAKDVETRFYISNLELDRPLPQAIRLMKDELGRKIMIELTALRPVILKDNNNENKKAKGTKNYAVKKKLTFETYKYCKST